MMMPSVHRSGDFVVPPREFFQTARVSEIPETNSGFVSCEGTLKIDRNCYIRNRLLGCTKSGRQHRVGTDPAAGSSGETMGLMDREAKRRPGGRRRYYCGDLKRELRPLKPADIRSDETAPGTEDR